LGFPYGSSLGQRFVEIDPAYYLHVENVRPSVRIGPDGFIVAETLVLGGQ
jgi:hypothetical protein